MTGIMAAREGRILTAIRAGMETSKQIGEAIGESHYTVSVYLNLMLSRGLVKRGPRVAQARGGSLIRWHLGAAAK